MATETRYILLAEDGRFVTLGRNEPSLSEERAAAASLSELGLTGASLNGSTAETESCGLLNPVFSLWLQGIPATWASCVPPVTRSIRTSRKLSSARACEGVA